MRAGRVPASFPEKRADYFCDNIDDDVLYNFHKSYTFDKTGQRHVTVTVTNTHVKIGD